MARFRCVYRDSSGKKHQDIQFAPSPSQLRNKLLASGSYPLSIVEVDKKEAGKKMKLNDVQIFAEALALLLSGGHTLKESIPLLRRFHPSPSFQNAVDEIAGELEKGQSFHQALEEGRLRFPREFISLAAIGERSGSLAPVMRHLGLYYKRIRSLRGKLGTASIYPALVVFVALAASVFLILVVRPRIIEMMRMLSVNAEELSSSSSMHLPAGLIIASGVLVFILIRYFIFKGNKNRAVLWPLKLPFIGRFIIEWNLMSWSFAMELLLSEHLVMDKALIEAADTVANRYLRKCCIAMADKVAKGESLSEVLQKEELFPPLVAQWLIIGENTGNSQDVFVNLREYFEERVSSSIDVAAQLIEPLIILLIGILIIIAVARFLLPFFQMMGGLL